MSNTSSNGLNRQLGLLGLAATGICSMLGASVYVVPFMIQRNVPGIGAHVLPAFLFAALPALLAAMAYATLASAMPRAGGSYIYASRSLSPYLGFVASFSQWFGLSIAIGVISYIIVPFLRDIAFAADAQALGQWLDTGWVRVSLALGLLWVFVGVNMLGLKFYERTLIPLMLLMFVLGAIVIIAGFSHTHDDFIAGVMAREGRQIQSLPPEPLSLSVFLAAAALLFSSFIGFDSIAQAGGEAKNPSRTLPLAIGIAILTVGGFYMLFTIAVYHAVPWNFIADEAQIKDITAPGLLTYLLPAAWGTVILTGAAIALINDLPAMLLSVSRLIFAWAEDGIFPKSLAAIHPRRHTPYRAIVLSGLMATIGILGSHFAGDFFLGIDIMVTSMLVNFLLMCVSVGYLPVKNPTLAARITVMRNRKVQLAIALFGSLLLSGFLAIHTWKDLNAPVAAWYFHSTPIWLIVMGIASLIFGYEYHKLKNSGADVHRIFGQLPPE